MATLSGMPGTQLTNERLFLLIAASEGLPLPEAKDPAHGLYIPAVIFAFLSLGFGLLVSSRRKETAVS